MEIIRRIGVSQIPCWARGTSRCWHTSRWKQSYSLLILVFCSGYRSSHCTTSVTSSSFGTKTTYKDVVARHQQNMTGEGVPGQGSTGEHRGYEAECGIKDHTCQLIQLNALARHGIRNVGSGDRLHFSALSRKILRYLSVPERAIWTELEERLNRSNVKVLLPEGRMELADLAQRLGKRFSSLFADSSSDEFIFMATTQSRTYDSGRGFIQGLADLGIINGFGDGDSVDVEVRDDILRFYDVCDRYVQDVDENKAALTEYHKYKDNVFNPIGRSFLKRVTRSQESTIDLNMKSVYIIAAMERALLGSTTIADHLTTEELAQLEYGMELKQYWKKGYGHSITYQQACPLVKDIFGHMDAAVRGARYSKGIFRFGHAETFLPLITLLGLYKDELPLMADNYPQQQHRLFRATSICPFTANLMFALYKCLPQDGGGTSSERYFVRLFHNERSIPFPFPCESPDNKVCEYAALRRNYAQIIDHWNFEEICAIHGAKHEDL